MKFALEPLFGKCETMPEYERIPGYDRLRGYFERGFKTVDEAAVDVCTANVTCCSKHVRLGIAGGNACMEEHPDWKPTDEWMWRGVKENENPAKTKCGFCEEVAVGRFCRNYKK
jgi:hypothetical protein